MNRREFLKRSSLALASGLVIGPPARCAGQADKMRRIGCTTTCFRTLFAKTRPKDAPVPERELTLLEVPDFFVENLSLHNIELWGVHFDDMSLAFCEKLRKATERAGSRVFNVQIDGPKYNLSASDPEERKASIATIKHWMDMAAALGAGSARANTGGRAGETFDLQVTADSFRQLAEYGQQIGVKILIENHGGHSTQPENIVAIVKAVDSAWCRTLPDFGNMPPGADESFRGRMLKMLFPYAHLASAKGMGFDSQGNHETYDIGECVRIGEACGFQGIYSAEYWDPKGRSFEPLQVTKRIIAQVLANI